MAGSGRTESRSGGSGWVATGLGVLVLVIGGFSLGLIVGVVSEEPELVVGHMAGRSTEVDWSAGAAVPGEGRFPAEADAPPQVAGSAASASTAGADPSPAAPEPVRPAPAPRTAAAAPAPALPPVAARGPAAPAAGGFAIQVGAFGTAEAAQGLAARLRSAGYPVRVVAPEKDDRWRVRVGPIASRDEADGTARRLKAEQSLPTWVLREERS